MNKCSSGDVAGYVAPGGYRRIGIDGRYHQASRLAWLFMTGEHPLFEIDHINRIKSDDRFNNLRNTTRSENLKNQSIRSNNTSGVTGVRQIKKTGSWAAYIKSGDTRKTKTFSGPGSFNDAVRWRKNEMTRLGFFVGHGT